MNEKERQALEMALEALEKYGEEGTAERYIKAKTAIKEALAQPEQEPVTKYCCHLCFNKSGQLFLDRMIVCPECGNKRCPKATHHELLCTNSNESNQAGSVYTTPPQRKPLTRAQIINALATTMNFNSRDYDEIIEPITRAIEAAHGIKE